MAVSVDPRSDPPSVDHLRTLDPDAWEALYVAARPALWRFARTRLATVEQAEDAVSETLLRAMSAVHRYEATAAGIFAWLVGIERNVVNEMYRTGARDRSELAEPVRPAADPVEQVVAGDDARTLRLAFAELRPDERELLGLRFAARLDAEATARVLGKRPGAIRMAQKRALGRLRLMLKEGDREP